MSEKPRKNESKPSPAGVKRDPLRPSAPRVMLLIAGGVLCVMAFGLGVWIGLLPLGYWTVKCDALIARAEQSDPTLDFAGAEWALVNHPPSADLPHFDFVEYAGEGAPLLVMVLLVPLIAVVGHILIARFAGWLAVRADRRLDLGLGARPARALAAAVMIRQLYRVMFPCSAICGVLCGLFLLGLFQFRQLRPLGLEWIVYLGFLGCVLALFPLDLWSTLLSARKELRMMAPLESRICNGCGYSLRGLPREAAACPECGRVLLDNHVFVSLILGQRAGHAVRWTLLAVLVFATLGAMLGLLVAPTARGVAVDWVLARPPAPGAWSHGSVIAPAGSVVRISDGITTAYVTARSLGEGEGLSVHTRVIELGAVAGPQRREGLGDMRMRPTTPIAAGPVSVFNSWPHGRSGVGVQLYANGGVAPAAISIRFASALELSADDWTWLTEKLPEVRDPMAPSASPSDAEEPAAAGE